MPFIDPYLIRNRLALFTGCESRGNNTGLICALNQKRRQFDKLAALILILIWNCDVSSIFPSENDKGKVFLSISQADRVVS